MRTHFLAWMGAMAISAGAFAADPSRVFPEGASSSDERLHVVHDVDHPVMFEPHFKDKAQWEKRRQEVREQILVAEGLWPEPPRTPLNAVVHGKIDRDGYTIEKVFFASMPGHYVSGNLYRPKDNVAKHAVVLCPHGHWKNGRQMENPEKEIKSLMDTGAEKTVEGARFPLQARCAMLARMGCVVFHYDMIGIADSQSIPHRVGFTDVEATLRLQSFMGLQTWNNIRCLDFVFSLPDVDTTRIGVTGASGGGTQTMILSAIDDRVAVSVPAVMVSESMQGGCICENAPLLRVDTNNAEFAALFAPKPLGMTSANDWTAEIETLGYPEIRKIYKLYGPKSANDVAAWHRSFPHNYNQVSRELMYNWMNKYLKLGQPEPVVEKPFVPVPPAELSVYDDKHPRPSDSLDAAGIRKEMTETNAQQMAELAKDPAQYRKTVGTALRVMVNATLPASSEILIGDDRGPRSVGPEYTMLKATIHREGTTSRIPCLALLPNTWNGTTTVWVHPDGKVSLFNDKGRPTADARALLDANSAIFAPDVFNTGELKKPSTLANSGKYAGYNYPGYHYGYNRAVVAEQARDILNVVAIARGWEGTMSVRLVAFGKTGTAALLARALAGDAITRASIDLDHFDFTDVKEPNDDRLLPGAVKYGGVWGIAALLNGGKTALWNAPAGGKPNADTGIEVHDGAANVAEIVGWVAK